jgi:hypothetical protein
MGEQNRRTEQGGADPAASGDPVAAPGLADAPHTTPARWPDEPAQAAPPPADTDEQSQIEDQAGQARPA